MTVDLKKLRRDASRLQKTRPQSTVGRRTTGTMEAIRKALPTIYQLRREGISWPAIADALADQGLVQGKNRDRLTTNRLTSIVTQLEAQAERQARKDAGRAIRPDVARDDRQTPAKLSLSNDLTGRPEGQPASVSAEEELRQAAYEKLQSVLKKE